jgi:hypothetical protein
MLFAATRLAIYSLDIKRHMYIYTRYFDIFVDLWFATTRVAGHTLGIIRHIHMYEIYTPYIFGHF